MYINGRVKILPLNCLNRGLSQMTRIARIVEFVYLRYYPQGMSSLLRLLSDSIDIALRWSAELWTL